MTHLTIGRELHTSVIGIFCPIISIAVATDTFVRRGGVIPIVAFGTIGCNSGMCAFQYVIVIVDIKPRRGPVGVRIVTGRAVLGQSQLIVIWVE